MSKLLTFLTVAFLFFGSSLQSQILTSRILPTGAGNAGKILRVNSNRFLIIGRGGDKHAYVLMVNRWGETVRLARFGSKIGGVNSEFTDVIAVPGGFLFAGYYDQQFADGSRLRRMFLLKTKTDLTGQKLVKYNPPPGTPAGFTFWGRQILNKWQNTYIVTTQLFKGSNVFDFTADFALLNVDIDLNAIYYRHYDYHGVDGVGDAEIANNSLYVLGWGIYGYYVGADSTYLWRFNPTNGNLIKESIYSGAGWSLAAAPNGDLYIAGAKGISFANPSDGWLLQVDANGNVLAETIFGTGNTDGVRDIQVLGNGNVIGTGVYDLVCPITFNPNDPATWEYGSINRVWYYTSRLGLFTCPLSFLIQSDPNIPTVYRSILSLNKDGSEFVAVGHYNGQSIWITLSKTPPPFSGLAAGQDSKTLALDSEGAFDRSEQGAETGTLAFYPSVAVSGERLQVTVASDATTVTAEIFDQEGRLISRSEIQAGDEITAPSTPGVYIVRLRDAGGEATSKRLLVKG